MNVFEGIKNAVSGGDEESSGNSTLDGLMNTVGGMCSSGNNEDKGSSGGDENSQIKGGQIGNFMGELQNAVGGGDEKGSGNSTLDSVIDGAAGMVKEKVGGMFSGGKAEDGESSGGVGELVKGAVGSFF
ncbi:hypothetical protein COCON_G00035060 [Conger conger]|uniref:Uncharacterized protein n=1 Tax=Conger conger TaxID=82655 RepID=A0A9Q1I7J5_CONCO|nr:hypothetical protein COCON_G00035060 [Conger conger]